VGQGYERKRILFDATSDGITAQAADAIYLKRDAIEKQCRTLAKPKSKDGRPKGVKDSEPRKPKSDKGKKH